MRSMTGFGSAASEQAGLALRAEVRTVNHKHLQVKVRLPAQLSFVEPDLEELVRKRLDRGSVSVAVTHSLVRGTSGIAVNAEAAQRYHKLLMKLAKELGLRAEVSLDTLAALPGVIGEQVSEKTLGREARAVLETVGLALDALDRMRAAEGRALQTELRKYARSIARTAAAIEKRMPEVVVAHQQSLAKRVQDLIGNRYQLEPADLAREVALLADKLDVTEELARLKSHFAQLETLLGQAGPVGRQLDFLVQELFREVNTIGSKCNDAGVAQSVVAMKSELERLREQVQNIE
jgi:uncharacterized protein (TIGR00255 family)